MKRFEFRIDITAHQYLSYYRGAIKQVVVQSTTGATVQFPASLLTQFITESGVHGQFVLTCDDDNRGYVDCSVVNLSGVIEHIRSDAPPRGCGLKLTGLGSLK